MSRCIRCNIHIEDSAISCPLCGGVVEQEDTEEPVQTSASVTYPNVMPTIRKMQLATKISILAAFVTEIALIIVNYATFDGVWWSLIAGLVLIYACFTLVYAFRMHKSLQNIMLTEMIVGALVVVLMDIMLGYRGWSFAYAIPVILTCLDVSVGILMIVGIDQWQSYILTEISTFLFSMILLGLGLFNIIELSLMNILCAAVTGLILLATVMFGERMISNEIRRRFRI